MSESTQASETTAEQQKIFEQAIQEINTGEFSAAETKLRQLLQRIQNAQGIQSDLQEPLIWNKLGVICAQTERLEEAKDCFNRSLELQPDQPTALTNLGNVFFLEDDVRRAEALHRYALELDPQYATARQNLAVLLKKQGRYKELIRLQRRGVVPQTKKTLGCLPIFAIAVVLAVAVLRNG